MSEVHGPKYLAIVESLAAAIRSGKLQAGDPLPTHRELADQLGVTVGTVSRAYAAARQRGLVRGEVGRGTFVLAPERSEQVFGVQLPGEPEPIGLHYNAPDTRCVEQEIARAWAAVVPVHLLGYGPNLGLPDHRRAGSEWIGRFGLSAPAEQVVVTAGAQHAMLLALSILTQPGDQVLTESLTYPGLISLASFLKLELIGLPTDGAGLLPEGLERAGQDGRAKLLYCMPTLHNPLATVMPVERRHAIAAICDEYALTTVEDDVYAYLLKEPLPPLAALVAGDAYYITSFSKCVAPGLRIGFLRLPESRLEAAAAAMATTVLNASPLSAQLVTQLIDSGVVDRIVARRQAEVAERHELTQSILGRWLPSRARQTGLHLWLELPAPWRAEQFVASARARGVAVASPELFAVGRAATPHAVRLSIGLVASLEQLEAALRTLAALLAQPPRGITTSGI